MTLASLIEERRRQLGGASLRDLSRRAADRGYKLSPTSLSVYATGKRTSLPRMHTREALAAALGVSRGEVEKAAGWVQVSTVSSTDSADGANRGAEHALAWAVLTEQRTDEEVAHLLSVVRTVLQGLDAQKAARQSDDPDASGE